MHAEQDRLAAPPDTIDDDPLLSAVMNPCIVAITPDAPLHTALRLMTRGLVRHLPVLDGTRCAGILVEADLVRAAAIGGPAVVGPLARPVPRIPLGARRSRAARALLEGGVDAVLVVDGERLVGIVTATDLVRSLAGAGRARRVVR
jgi:CBS domain-containing protein